METGTNREVLQMESRDLDYTRVEASLVGQLREYCERAKQRGYIIGISGGVDSAVTSTLCAKTGLPLYVVEMPIHQREEEVNRAQEHITWLKANYPNVRNVRADLTEAFEVFKKIGNEVDEILGDNVNPYMSLVNTRSRHRMEMLYYIGGSRQFLVAGTGNKVEDYGIGFFTKYGDGGVDVSPIGELYKSEVRELGRHMGILPSLTEAVPTDGLHTDGATDEDQIGATYNELEWAMPEYDAGKRIVDFSGRARQVMEIYTSRHEVNNHKMSMPPVFSIGAENI